jgi:tetratricopeptide (TPR) repeat protein
MIAGAGVRTGICVVLVALVFAVFGQTVRFGFCNYDDHVYVYQNNVVLRGLSPGGIGWAFTHGVSSNWHPLTVMVHMLDSQLYGRWAGGHHLTNVILHAACAVLLFLMLEEMTGASWRSAFVAAVFAIHPLRVESVAWISELKDVLSGIFFVLTLWAYVRYARGKSRYAMVMVWLALGLLSKPMLVTTPFVLLLMDYWPLGRLQSGKEFPRLLREKLPLIFLVALSCVATVIAQKDATQPIWHVSLGFRICNALIAYAVYLWKLAWPSQLAVLYPLSRNGLALWEVLDAVLVLCALSAGAWLLRRKQPYLLMGWLWYLGMLVPVIGVMQVGTQAYADRYTYLPQIGICIAITWMAADWAALRAGRRLAVAGTGVVIVCALAAAAWHQTRYWSDNATLWAHTVESTSDNYLAIGYLGMSLYERGEIDAAIAQLEQAIALAPDFALGYNNLGDALVKEGRNQNALAQYSEAVRLEPKNAMYVANLGVALCKAGRTGEGINALREAVRLDPDSVETCRDLGVILCQVGQAQEGIALLQQAAGLDPTSAEVHYDLGNALSPQGRTDEAIAQYREALRLNPAYAEAAGNLGGALFQRGDVAEAIGLMEKALQLEPANVATEGSLAWVLSTATQGSLRDGPRAVALALRASEAAGGANPVLLRTLAAAYAQAGRFPEAVETGDKALMLARAQSNATIANLLPREIKLYQAGHPYEKAQ